MQEITRRVLQAKREGKIIEPANDIINVTECTKLFAGTVGKSTIHWIVKKGRVNSYKSEYKDVILVSFKEVYKHFTERV